MLLGTSSLSTEVVSCGGSEMWVWYFVVGVCVIYLSSPLLYSAFIRPALHLQHWILVETIHKKFEEKEGIWYTKQRGWFLTWNLRERKLCVKPHGHHFLSLTSEDDNTDFHSSLQMARSQVIQLMLASCAHVCAEDAPLVSATAKNSYLSYSEKETLRYFKIVLIFTRTTAKKHGWDRCSK